MELKKKKKTGKTFQSLNFAFLFIQEKRAKIWIKRLIKPGENILLCLWHCHGRVKDLKILHVSWGVYGRPPCKNGAVS